MLCMQNQCILQDLITQALVLPKTANSEPVSPALIAVHCPTQREAALIPAPHSSMLSTILVYVLMHADMF